jgi:regulatory protein
MPFQKKKRSEPPSPDAALTNLERFCAYRERSPKEVRAKLRELGVADDLAEQIFSSLRADGFFEEKRFALAYATGKFRYNHWGKVRIRMELRMHDIRPALIEKALNNIDVEEYTAVLQKLIEQKRRQYAADAHAREKIAASLMRTGFESELIFQYL